MATIVRMKNCHHSAAERRMADLKTVTFMFCLTTASSVAKPTIKKTKKNTNNNSNSK